MILETPDGQRRRVERLMLGTSTLGAARVIVVSRHRMHQRGFMRERSVLIRWAYRQIARLADEWQVIDGPSIRYSEDHGDLWLRDLGAYRVDVPAVRRTKEADR